MDQPTVFPVLVADIGGTHARFALAEPCVPTRPAVSLAREYEVRQFASLGQAALHYLTCVGHRPRGFVVAVASAIVGDCIKVTNNDWSFSIEELRRQLELERIKVINDFAAVGLAIPHLLPHELEPIGQAEPGLRHADSDRHYAALGPGTGMGVCRVLLRKGRAIVLESEGGHIAFAPGSDYEIAILQAMMKRFARVSVERLICGPGLLNLYQAVCAVDGVPGALTGPEQITAAALAGADAQAVRAVEQMCAMLGSFAGDVALIHGAWDGVYLGGGLTATLMPWLARGEFRRRFADKGRFAGLVRTIPTFAIARVESGLLGAAAWAVDAWGASP